MRLTFLIFILLIGQWCFPQGNLLWKGYFSYNEIIDVEASSTAFFAATENGVFYKNTTQQDVNILNSVNGFKPNAITAIHYSESFKKTIAGDQNGLLLLANEDGTITTKVDIIEEIPVAPNKKKINDNYFGNNI